jgi:glycosyltransferase involved in cell wall biosynthesis
LKILFDHQIFLSQKYGGVSRYFVELMKEFDKIEVEYSLTIKYCNNAYIQEVKEVKKFKENKLSSKIFYYFSQFVQNQKLKKSEFDIFHPTYYNPYFLKNLDEPYVLTVYDFMHEKFADMFDQNDKNIHWKKKASLKADRLIAISENTKKDIIKYYGVAEDKIDVVYLASSLVPMDNPVDIVTPKEYILFVGNRGRYKNFQNFIEAITPLLKEQRDLYVVCAGGEEFYAGEIELFKSLGIEDRVLRYYIDDDILAHLYQNALFFIFPSLYEGFGIPVLEAFNCNCPVALSNQGSLPEVGGEAVEYFDPYSKDSIYEAVSKLLKDESRRGELIAKGKTQAKKFSWENVAKQTFAVYNKLL